MINHDLLELLSQPPSRRVESKTHRWQGQSGRWWVTTVYPLLAQHLDWPSVYVMVRRDMNNLAHPLYIGQTSDTSRRMSEHASDKLRQAVGLGGNEIHLYYLDGLSQHRIDVETDLRNGHATPLNRQTYQRGLGMSLDNEPRFGALFGLGKQFI